MKRNDLRYIIIMAVGVIFLISTSCDRIKLYLKYGMHLTEGEMKYLDFVNTVQDDFNGIIENNINKANNAKLDGTTPQETVSIMLGFYKDIDSAIVGIENRIARIQPPETCMEINRYFIESHMQPQINIIKNALGKCINLQDKISRDVKHLKGKGTLRNIEKDWDNSGQIFVDALSKLMGFQKKNNPIFNNRMKVFLDKTRNGETF